MITRPVINRTRSSVSQTRVLCRILEMGCQRISGVTASEASGNFFKTPPYARFGGVKIDLRPPGGGVFDLKYCHCAGLRTRRLQRSEISDDNLTQANLFRSVGNSVLVLR